MKLAICFLSCGIMFGGCCFGGAAELTLDDYLDLRDAIGKRLVFELSGRELTNVLMNAAGASREERPTFFQKLGTHNLSSLLMTRQTPVDDPFAVEAPANVVLQVAMFRGRFGKSLVLPTDLELISISKRSQTKVSGACRVNVLDAITVDLCFEGRLETDGRIIITTLGIAQRETKSIDGALLFFEGA